MIHEAKAVLPIGVSLLGRFPIPFDRLNIILRHAFAEGIHPAKLVLRIGILLLGGFAIPLGRLDIILRHAFAKEIHIAKLVLRIGIPLLGFYFRRLEKPDFCAFLPATAAQQK